MNKKTSIILLTFNKLEYTQLCISSIRKYTNGNEYQLIVVDNNSTDGTREWLAEQTDILSIFNHENVGFPKGCNQGIELATGDNILLLNNDVVVTENWLRLMNDCLYSADDIGAVGPMSNSAYGDQEIECSYKTLDEMWEFANGFNRNSSPVWERKLKLIGFCMLIKREALQQVGLLDEIFSPGMCEDGDYSFRLVDAGYKLMLCHNVFIHHFGSTSFGEMPEQRKQLWLQNREVFKAKWGFPISYPTRPEELVRLVDANDSNRPIRVLDIGCGCGATLLKVKHKFPNAELFGIEPNKRAASIASTFADVTVADFENIQLPSSFFDYIILGNVLQNLNDPWSFLRHIQGGLKENGRIILVVPNASHYSTIFSLIKGGSLYNQGQILQREQSKLFTNLEIRTLIEEAGYDVLEIEPKYDNLSEAVLNYISQIAAISGVSDYEHLKAERYVLKISSKSRSGLGLNEIIADIYRKSNSESDSYTILANGLKNGDVQISEVITAIKSLDINHQLMLNVLANRFYNEGLYNDIIPLLNASLEIDYKHSDTLYNYALIMHNVGADDQALMYLNLIDEHDSASAELLNKINTKNL